MALGGGAPHVRSKITFVNHRLTDYILNVTRAILCKYPEPQHNSSNTITLSHNKEKINPA
jgi:hypothetical protein